MNETKQFSVSAQHTGLRLDAFLSEQCTDLSRATIKRSIETGDVAINGLAITKAARKVALNDVVTLVMPQQIDLTHPLAETIPLNIVYTDEHLCVINKPAGLVVHPGAGHLTGTLVNALLAFDANIATIGEPDRPGIVHRLDAETSGLLVVARSQAAYTKLVDMFSRHDVHRQYWAICHAPSLPDQGTFDTPYGRHPTQRVKYTSFAGHRNVDQNDPDLKRAITHYQVLKRNPGGYALVTCKLETGRTHQIRVHLSEHGAPLLADPLYSPAKFATHRAIQRLALHAGKLEFIHPISGETMTFNASFPNDFKQAIRQLNLVDDTLTDLP